MFTDEKPLEWIASSYKDLLALPAGVRQRFGFALSLAQMGDRYEKTKILKGFGGAGVLEIVEDHIGDTYRAVYTVKFEEAVFVLHCFQKKKQKRKRYAADGHGHHPDQTEDSHRQSRGVTSCKKQTLREPISCAAAAMSSPTWACQTPTSCASRPDWSSKSAKPFAHWD